MKVVSGLLLLLFLLHHDCCCCCHQGMHTQGPLRVSKGACRDKVEFTARDVGRVRGLAADGRPR